MPESADAGSFEADEAAVLNWLLTQKNVSKAVDLALAERPDEALPILEETVQTLLADDDSADAGNVLDASDAAVAVSDPYEFVVSDPYESSGAADCAGSSKRLKSATGPSLLADDDSAAAGNAPDASDAVAAAASSSQSAGAADSVGSKRSAADPTSEDASPIRLSKRLKCATGLARCVFIFLSGLQGSGKSALSNILREVLGGTWLNVDEVASKNQGGRNLRQAFANEVRAACVRGLASVDQNRLDRLVIVDRPNTTRSHRVELINLLKRLRWQTRGGAVMFVDFDHSSNTFGYGADGQLSKRCSEQHITTCVNRVELRGAAHHTFRPFAKLRGTLQAAAKAAEAPSAEELASFDARVTLDVSQSPPDQAEQVFEELRRLGWLGTLRSASELRPRIEVAWQAYQRAESQWRAGAAVESEQQSTEWLSQCRRVLEADRKLEAERAERLRDKARQDRALSRQPSGPTPLYWKIDLPEVSKVLSHRGVLPSSFVPVQHPHTTLLYLGGDNDDAAMAKKSNLSIEQFQAMRDALEALQGETFEVKVTEIVVEESVACAVVLLPPILPCANKVPHVTLGTKQGVAARYANEVLEEVRAGRLEGVTSIPLPAPRALKGRVVLEYTAPAAGPLGVAAP